MPIKMKALKSFGVRSANEGHISRGREFTVAHEQRARDLEDLELAYRLHVDDTKMAATHLNKMEPRPENKAASSGPLDSPGGTIGAAEPAPSLQAAPAPRRRRSKKFAADLLS